MPKFTQGSWLFHDEYILTANKGRIIADVMATLNKDEFNANGRLIASAPEMYRWLLEVLGNEKIHKSTEKAIEKLLARIDEEENKKMSSWLLGINDDNKWCIEDANSCKTIADDIEQKRDARLIAAAPEMYQYLKDITSHEDIFEPTKINIDTLLARIDGEEENA